MYEYDQVLTVKLLIGTESLSKNAAHVGMFYNVEVLSIQDTLHFIDLYLYNVVPRYY